MVAIFCRRSRWRNSFRPLGSPDSLTRQSEKRLSSSFEKRGENPRRPLQAPLRILNYLDKRLPFAAKSSYAGVIDHPRLLICHREWIDVHDHLKDANASSAKNAS